MNELLGADVPNPTYRNHASAAISKVNSLLVAARRRPEFSKWSRP